MQQNDTKEPFFGPEHAAAPLHCIPGREQEAYAVVADVDEWNCYVAELLRLPVEVIGPSQMRIARWKAAELFEPSRLPADAPRRLMYRNVDIPVRYSHIEKVDDTTLDMRRATLISSMREDGSQQPALDLDFPTWLWRDGSRFWLQMYPKSPALDYHGPDMLFEADRALALMGLHRSSGRPDLMVDCAPVGHSAFMLGPVWGGSFEDLIAAARTVTPLSGVSEPPADGVWYEVEGDAVVVPSTSWYHLYTDRTLTTSEYRMAVHVAAGCGVLNPGFANGMEDRGFTSLRSPGLLKKDPGPLPFDDIPF